jgi:hypothetical protein
MRVTIPMDRLEVERERVAPAFADVYTLAMGLLAGACLLAVLLLVCFSLWKRLPLV